MGVVQKLVDGSGGTARLALDQWHPVAEEWKAADTALPATAEEIEAENEEREEPGKSRQVAHRAFRPRFARDGLARRANASPSPQSPVPSP